MKAAILAFGITKELLGNSMVELNLPDAATVGDLKNALGKTFPALNNLASFRIAVNGHFSLPGEVIRENDEIALIPPVSGG
jgi:molybdopterin converting factor small subunit